MDNKKTRDNLIAWAIFLAGMGGMVWQIYVAFHEATYSVQLPI